MKVYKKETENFHPVIVELESQEEVNILYAIISYIPITDALGHIFIKELWGKLNEFSDKGYEKWFQKISNKLKVRE